MKRSRHLALMLMGSGPLLLSACAEDRHVDGDHSDEGLFTSVQACIDQTNDSYSCRQAYERAEREAEQAAPRYATREECIAEHGPEHCQERQRHGSTFFVPLMAGYLMGRAFSAGNVTGLNGSPAFRDRNGGWQRPAPAAGGVYRPGSVGQRTALAPVQLTPNRAPTVTRSGFGNRNNQRTARSSGS
jgi:uncharacterized protein YgiB involved in biofilm formation